MAAARSNQVRWLIGYSINTTWRYIKGKIEPGALVNKPFYLTTYGFQ